MILRSNMNAQDSPLCNDTRCLLCLWNADLCMTTCNTSGREMAQRATAWETACYHQHVNTNTVGLRRTMWTLCLPCLQYISMQYLAPASAEDAESQDLAGIGLGGWDEMIWLHVSTTSKSCQWYDDAFIHCRSNDDLACEKNSLALRTAIASNIKSNRILPSNFSKPPSSARLTSSNIASDHHVSKRLLSQSLDIISIVNRYHPISY